MVSSSLAFKIHIKSSSSVFLSPFILKKTRKMYYLPINLHGDFQNVRISLTFLSTQLCIKHVLSSPGPSSQSF